MTITDHYGLCEDGLVAVLRTLTDFFPNESQVMQEGDDELTKGVKYIARVHPGAIPENENIAQEVFVTWEILCDIFLNITELKTMWTDFKSLRSAIFWTVHNHPTLGGVAGVDSVTLTAREEPKGMFEETVEGQTAKEPMMLTQELSIIVLQRVAITGGEYA